MKSKKKILAAKKAWRKRRKRKPSFRVRYIKKYSEHIKKEDYTLIPRRIRGIYALLNKKGDNYNVVYVGMSRSSIKGRIRSHFRSKKKEGLWSHFTIFEVNNNIYDEEIRELEALFRVIYRKDKRANTLNKQKTFKWFKKLKINIKKLESM